MNVVKYTNVTTKDEETGESKAQEVKLAGATFKLSTDKAGENVMKFHALSESIYEVCANADCTKEHVTEITTDDAGTFKMEGLDAGTYYLTETVAPAGYNKQAGSIEVAITGAASESGSLAYTTVETKVLNQAGTKLPSTGGVGTTIFYVAGGVLVLAAVVLLITRRRMGRND